MLISTLLVAAISKEIENYACDIATYFKLQKSKVYLPAISTKMQWYISVNLTHCHNIGVSMSWSNPLLTLYHGTVKVHADDILETGVKLLSNRALDFGTGFYTTTSQSQARKWAITVSRLAKLRHFPDDDRKPVVLRFSVHRDELAKFEFLGFVRPTEDYWQLVKHCRCSSVNTNRRAGNWYDVCLGPLAQNWDTSPPRFKPDSDQISFHTVEVIKTLLVSPIIEAVL